MPINAPLLHYAQTNCSPSAAGCRSALGPAGTVIGNVSFLRSQDVFYRQYPLKADIDAWFQAGNSLPRTVEKTLEMLALWAE